MYDIIFDEGYWWITKDGRILKDIGSFIDPVSPKIIIKEIENELDL